MFPKVCLSNGKKFIFTCCLLACTLFNLFCSICEQDMAHSPDVTAIQIQHQTCFSQSLCSASVSTHWIGRSAICSLFASVKIKQHHHHHHHHHHPCSNVNTEFWSILFSDRIHFVTPKQYKNIKVLEMWKKIVFNLLLVCLGGKMENLIDNWMNMWSWLRECVTHNCFLWLGNIGLQTGPDLKHLIGTTTIQLVGKRVTLTVYTLYLSIIIIIIIIDVCKFAL